MVWRFYDNSSGKAIADVITLATETIDTSRPYEIFDPLHTWKRKTLTNFSVRSLLEPIFIQGQTAYTHRPIEEIRTFCASELDRLWESLKRFENPQNYYVDLSLELWQTRNRLLTEGNAT